MAPADLRARRGAAAGPLRSLAESLVGDLEPWLDREIHFPERKALLSRTGGRCDVDGTMLDFDPASPHSHRCPRCGRVFTGELHDRFWIYWYQLWLAERAVHGATLWALGRGDRFAAFATRVLEGYAARYLDYPNVDNVLGPTRLFFSTYLESIWLLQICVAADILSAADESLADRIRSTIVVPSRDIIAGFDEGGSNRQVWNGVALLAAAAFLDDRTGIERAVTGPSGIARQIEGGLLGDGTWYEGENYHLFAHRGLWYGVTMAEHAGVPIDSRLVARFQRGFAAPFLSALPDFTLPSRRDSQYAISLRQWRIAEHCELGLARVDESTLRGALARMYFDAVPRGNVRRDRSSADVERNVSASSLTRADLSWRALLFARPELPPLEATAPASTLLDGQGLAVFRRDAGRAYVALDYGHAGGGHGHPDRLNLLLARGDTRWLDDYGTGSYVDRSLHWYRSTLAHNAPLAAGRSQRPVDGTLLAYDERPNCGWVDAEAEIAPGVSVRRSVVILDDYLVESLTWENAGSARKRGPDRECLLDLPIHAPLEVVSGASAPERASLGGAHGLEDGFDFARDTELQRVPAGTRVVARATHGDRAISVWAYSSVGTEWWRAVAPGPPGRGDRTFRIVRSRTERGRHVLVWSWGDAVVDAKFAGELTVSLSSGATHRHWPVDGRWSIEMARGGEREVVTLDGQRPRSSRADASRTPPPSRTPLRLTRGRDLVFSLGGDDYRRSEQSWDDAGRPTADVALRADSTGLRITVVVSHSDVTFAPRNAENPFDNESADVNGDGVQLYARIGDAVSGWMLVPELGGDTVRVRSIDGAVEALRIDVRARWSRSGAGYRLIADLAAVPSALAVVVNEMPRGRLRRRGQLVLGGARGEFVYLRGDRFDEARLLPLDVVDA